VSLNLEAEVERASALRQAGRWAEAAAAYQAILSARQDLPNSWYNLGLCLRRAGHPEEALAAYDQALSRGIQQPEEVCLNRAVILLDDLNKDQEGEAELQRALALNPDYAPALMNLANLAEDRGRRTVAQSLYARILALPQPPLEALARAITVHGPAGMDAPLMRQAAAALNTHTVALEDKASLAFAMGKALDAIADYDNAFAAYALANRIARAITPPHQRYDRAAHAALIDAIIAAHPKDAPSDPQDSDNPNLTFICGLFRSGSTLCEQVLSGHPRVTPGGELPLIPRVAAETRYPAPIPTALITDARAMYRAAIAQRFPAADILTDKRPDNFLYLGLIKRIFPTAKIIHTIRDPRDNALSLFFLHLDPAMSYAQDLGDIAHYIAQYQRLMAHWKACFGQDIIDFHYDDFVQAPRQAMEPMLRALGLDWADALLSFHERANRVRTASVWQVREPLYTKASGRWRHYGTHLSALDWA
jgi:tetratricopeptide (TPR) repeat protein